MVNKNKDKRTDNIMVNKNKDKRTNNDIKNTTQKNKD